MGNSAPSRSRRYEGENLSNIQQKLTANEEQHAHSIDQDGRQAMAKLEKSTISNDSELNKIIEAWPTLCLSIRRAMLILVELRDEARKDHSDALSGFGVNP